MRHFQIFLITITCSIVFSACGDQSKTASEAKSVFDMDSARSSISTSNSRFAEAIQRGDSTAVATFYTSDAQVLAPNSDPISGQTGIISFMGAGMRMGIKNAKFLTTELYGGEDGLTEVGNYELYGEGGKIFDRGKYIVLWKKENGVWKMHRDMFSSNMPVPSSSEK